MRSVRMHFSLTASFLCGALLLTACDGGGSSLLVHPNDVTQAPTTKPPSSSARRIVASTLTRPYTMPSALPNTFTLNCPHTGLTEFPVLCSYVDPGASSASYMRDGDTNCGITDVQSFQLPRARIGFALVRGYSPGACTVSLTDSNGQTASATITFSGRTILGPLSLTCPANASGSANCTYADPNYTGTYAVETNSNTCTATTPASGGFTVSDTGSETCTVRLIAVKTGQQAQAQIQFTIGLITGGGGGGGSTPTPGPIGGGGGGGGGS